MESKTYETSRELKDEDQLRENAVDSRMYEPIPMPFAEKEPNRVLMVGQGEIHYVSDW